MALSSQEALAVVGLTVRQVADCVDRECAEGSPHLVGSLASGLGNGRSDVDVHVLAPGLDHAVGPTLHQITGVTIDVEQYPAVWAAQAVARLGAVPAVERPFGRISLDRAVDEYQRGWLSRWIHSVPVRSAGGAVFSEADVQVLLPGLVRQAHDRVLIDAAVALLADDADRRGSPVYSASARDYFWARAARGLLELRCRAAGDVTTGEKWLPARARRLGLRAVPRDGEVGPRVLAGLGWSAAEILAAVLVGPAPDAAPAELAGRRFLVNRHDRLLESWISPHGGLDAVLEEHSPAAVLHAVRSAACDLTVDEALVRERLAA